MVTSASQGILFVLRLASIVVLARMLIPEHFGLIGMVTSLTILIERFQDLGLGDAIVQREQITHDQVSTLFWVNLGISLLLTILVALSAKVVGWFYEDDRLIWITVAFSSNFIFSGTAIQHQALIRRQMHFRQFALIQVFSTMFGFFIAILLAWLGYGYWALVWKELARSLLNAILAWSLCRWRPGLPVRNSGVRSMLKFGCNVTGFNFLYFLSNNLDSILIGKFCGAVPVGLYSRAKQLTTIPLSQLLEPVRYVSLPALSALQNDPVKYQGYHSKMLSVLCFLYMPLIVYIGIYSHPVVLLSLGSQWLNAVPLFRLLAISMFVNPMITMLGLILLSSGQTARYFCWGLFTASTLALGFAIGIKWGAKGVAASWIFSTIANFVFSLFYVYKETSVRRISTFKAIYKSVIASLLTGIVLFLTYDYFASFHIFVQVALSTVFAMVLYFLFWILFPGGYKQIREFCSYPISAFIRHEHI